MEISKLPKPALFNLLLQIEPIEIRIVCNSKNPKVREICQLPRFMEEYKNKHKDEGFLFRFDKPIFLDSHMIKFLLNADFEKYNSKIHEAIDPLIKNGIFNRIGLTLIYSIYSIIKKLKFIEGNKKFYRTDEFINEYLEPYLIDLEKEKIKDIRNKEGKISHLERFNRNKFSLFRLGVLFQKGIIPSSEYSLYDKMALNSYNVQKSLENAIKILKDVSRELKNL